MRKSRLPSISNRRLLARSRLFALESFSVEFSNGTEREYERVARASEGCGVLIVPVLDRSTVLLIREYCAAVGRYELGFPKGRMEAGEAILASAERELKEETGYGARSLRHLTTFSLAPGYFEHETEIVLARDLYPEQLEGDEPEPLEVVPWPLADIQRLVASGQCTEARSIAAFYMTREIIENEQT